MDLLSMPENILHKIISYLPFEQQVLIGGTCKRLNRRSKVLISNLKTLNLSDSIFDLLTVNQFSVILNLCHRSLQTLHIPSTGYDDLIEQASRFIFPRLKNLVLRTEVSNEVLAMFLNRTRCLKTFILKRDNCIILSLAPYKFHELETLHMSRFGDQTVNTIIGNVPNLKNFSGQYESVDSEPLLKFFESIRALEYLDLTVQVINASGFASLRSFWKLQNLKTLHLDFWNGFVGNSFLTQISESFPNLESLHLESCNANGEGIAALQSLVKLQTLKLTQTRKDQNSVSAQGIQQLMKLKELLELDISYLTVAQQALTSLIRFCSELKSISILNIGGIESVVEAIEFAQSFLDLPPREIEIYIKSRSVEIYNVWAAEEVGEFLNKMEEDGGPCIEIKVEYRRHPFFFFAEFDFFPPFSFTSFQGLSNYLPASRPLHLHLVKNDNNDVLVLAVNDHPKVKFFKQKHQKLPKQKPMKVNKHRMAWR